MAPISCRHTLIWSLPTLAVLLTFLWYKSRRGSSRSDPGGTAKGTRKAKKQEEKTARVASSLLADRSEKSVKSICPTSRDQTVIGNGSHTTGILGLELGHPEAQQSEINIATKTIKRLTVENTVPPTKTDFYSDASKIVSVEKDSENCFDLVVERRDNNKDNKNSLIEVSDKSKESCVVNVNSDSRPSADDNSVSLGEAHCDPKESYFDVKPSCKIAIQENTVFEAPAAQVINSDIGCEVVFPPESDTRISILVESTAENFLSDPKEIKCETSNLQESVTERGLQTAIPSEIHTVIAVPEVAVQEETISKVAVKEETIFEVPIKEETISEVAVKEETNSEVAAQEETNSEVAAQEETNSEVAAQEETNSEVAAQEETNSEVAVSKETNSDIIVLQETVSGVAVPENTISEVPALQEINSDTAVAQKTDSDLVAAQETVSEVAVPKGEDSKVVVIQQTPSEVTVSQDRNPEKTISEVDNLSINSECSDCSRVLYSNTISSGSEEVISVTECNSTEDLTSSSVLAVSRDPTDRETEEGNMPEPVREDWTLEKSSDIQAESVSETQRKDTGQTCGENSVSSQNKDSAAAQSPRMQTPPPMQEVSEDVDTTAPSSSCGLEGKLAALELGKGRDSANHSPAEVMLASPSASSYSDEGSSDSGKGCSDLATPPSRTPASGSSVSGDATALSVYEFVLPQHLVGRLIGRHGAFVHQIKAKTNASILIKRHPDTQKLKICAVEGTQLDIESALEMIRKKFPLKHYPSITLEQVCFVPPVPVYPVLPECLQLMLVEGVSNDVILSSLVTPGHFFLQQPTHPTFPALNRLNACMNLCYSEPNVPVLPTPVDPGVICAAPTMGGWYRAQVVSVEPETNMCEVKFVDYGGYLSLEHTALRQIRSDFMTLPFQASECFLANVIPAGGEEASWSADAAAVMEELTHGQVLQAQVCDYTEENIPNVFLYAVHCNQVVLVNQELVLRGLAEWWQSEEVNDVSCL